MNNNTNATINSCKICGDRTHPLVDEQLDVTYDVCTTCDFIYKQPYYHVPLPEEKERYLFHHNNEDNIGYVTYLTAFMKESILPLTGVHTILDFGSGPEPMLQNLLLQRGYQVDAFDPFFNNDLSYQTNTYDLIVLTEVLEHIHEPLKTLHHLLDRLSPGGRILIMTQFRSMSEEDFLTWWYRRDVTHVGFFNEDTFVYLANALHCTIEYMNHIDRIVLST